MKVTQSIAAMLVLSAAFALSGCKGGASAGTDVGPTPGHLDSTDNPPPNQGGTQTPPPGDDRAPPPADDRTPPPADDPPPPEDTQPGPIGGEEPPPVNDPPPVTPPPVTPPPDDPLPTPSTGSATLTWEAPTQNTDGSALTNLKGFVISYGTKASELTESISVPTQGVLTYVVDGLTTGATYYFSVAATNSDGVQSAQSAIVSKSIH